MNAGAAFRSYSKLDLVAEHEKQNDQHPQHDQRDIQRLHGDIHSVVHVGDPVRRALRRLLRGG